MDGKAKTRRTLNFDEDKHDGREASGVQEKLFELDAQRYDFDSTASTTPEYTPEELASDLRKLKRARGWRERNPHAYKVIDDLACKEARSGRKFGSKFLTEVCRQKGITEDESGEDFTMSNDYTAVFARWLRSEHPEFAHLIRIRACALDVVMADGHD